MFPQNVTEDTHTDIYVANKTSNPNLLWSHTHGLRNFQPGGRDESRVYPGIELFTFHILSRSFYLV